MNADTKERLNKAYNYLKFKGVISKQQDVAEKMGATRPNVAKALNGNEGFLTESFLKRFAHAFNDTISAYWLLTGEGEMLTTDTPVVEQTKQENEEPDGKLIPLLPLSAEGGSLDGFDNLGVSLPDCEVIYSPIKDADMAITVSGKSMNPIIPRAAAWSSNELTTISLSNGDANTSSTP